MARSNWRGRADAAGIERHISSLRQVEATIREELGHELVGLKILDIGAGQLASHLHYFGVHNEAIGIDLDVYPRRLSLSDWVRLLRLNGPRRLAKTAARRLMGVDCRFRDEMAKQLGVARLREPEVLYMDAAAMEFPDASFDVVYSFDVFEHLAEPERAIREITRVLKPGGAIYISLQHWASDNGCHDLRVINRARADLPHWAHLRPACTAAVERGAYCNELSVERWRELFRTVLPGARLQLRRSARPELASELEAVRASGELAEFGDEELLADRLTVLWRNPASRSNCEIEAGRASPVGGSQVLAPR